MAILSNQFVRVMLSATVSLASFAAANAARAENVTADASSAEAGGPSRGLDEIVVTARKRVEKLQDISSSISAVTSKDLARRFDTDIRDFQNVSPNIVIEDTQQGPGGVASIHIRGIGVSDVEKSVDPAVGVLIDDIYLGQSSGALLKALDVDRVEVLRGPQGTLFGRNATGGAISITRSRPTQELTGKARISYANYNTIDAQGVISFGLMPNLAIKLTGAYNSTDGYIWNATQHQPGQKSDFQAVGGELLFTPINELELSVSYDHQLTHQDASQLVSVPNSGDLFCAVYNQCSPAPGVPTSGNPYISLTNAPLDKGARFKLDMAIGKAKYELGNDFAVQYILGYLKTSEAAEQGWDGSPYTLYHTDRPARWRQTTNEIRLTKGGSGPLNFVLGGYMWDSNYTINLKNYIGFYPAFGVNIPLMVSGQNVTQTNKSYAGYFEGDYHITRKLKLTLGGRFTRDKKTSIVNDTAEQIINPYANPSSAYYGNEPQGLDNTLSTYSDNPALAIAQQLAGMNNLFDPGNVVATIPPSLANGNIVMTSPVEASWSKFTPKVSLSYSWTPDVMTYALWSRGYRGGGFNGRPATMGAATIPYNPETLDNFELGFKSEMLDHRLRLNGSLYLMKYKDMQEDLDVPAPGTSTGRENRTVNAARADIKGFEIDLLARVTSHLTISGNLGYTDCKYKDFIADIHGTGTPVDASFLKLRFAPKVTWDIGPTWEQDVGAGTLYVNGNLHYVGPEETTFLNNPNLHNGKQYILDAAVNYKIHNTMVSVFGKNLTRDKAWTIGYDVQGVWSYAAPRPPLTFGAAVTYNF